MESMNGEPTVPNHQESYQYLCLRADARPKDENSSRHSDAAPSHIQHYGADSTFYRERVGDPADSNTHFVGRAGRLPFDLRFTPVNSPTDNTVPLPPNRSGKVFLRQPSSLQNQYYARNCRLIGFTPLTEDAPTSSEEDAPQFLGPRKVKAKEVAPCALFYKRADVFVSSEMKSQNVLAYSENHYRNLRFADEVSISEIEYAPEPTNQGGEGSRVPKTPINIGELNQIESFQAKEAGSKIHPQPLCADREPIGHTFPQDRLTSMPLVSGARLKNDCCHIFGDETDSPLTAVSRAEQRAPWETSCKPLSSDLGQSIPSINSSGIQSGLWESTLSSLTRATSPVSSAYSNLAPAYDHQPLRESLSITEANYSNSRFKLMGFSHFTINTENQTVKSPMTAGAFDWEEDHGSLADDENGSDCSSIQLESDNNQESNDYACACFELIPSPPLTGSIRKGEAVPKNKSAQLTGSRI